MVLGALGVIYGDIGTSPLYTEQVIFTSHANAAHPVVAGVYGIVSLHMVEVEIPVACSNDVYEQVMGQALAEAPLAEAATIAFGDLFLADIRAYREERLRRVGKQAIFPLWGRDTGALAREFIALGFEGVVVCVDPRQLDPSFAGRRFDTELLADLPPDVDPCGENGEFHTFVHAGPIFSAPIACQIGEVVERDRFVFCDVMPADTQPSLLPADAMRRPS